MPSALRNFLILLCALLLVAAGLVLALAGTADGTRLLAEQARRWSGGTLEFDQIEGRLLGGLRLQGVRVRQPALSLDLQTLALDWRPRALLVGRLQIERLEAAGIRVEIPASDEQSPPSDPFRPGEVPLPLDVWLQEVTVRDLQVRLGEQPPRTVDRIELTARLEGRQLSLQRFELRTPEGGVAASGRAGLSDDLPVEAALEWDWVLPDRRVIGGHLRASGNAARLTVEHEGGGELPIDLDGELLDILDRPGWQLSLSWPELPLAPGEGAMLLGPATLQSSGRPDAFELSSEGRFLGPGLDPVRWSLKARGSSAGLDLSPLLLTTGPAELAVTGSLDWRGPVSADLEYHASGADLAELQAALPPRLDARGLLRGSFQNEQLVLERLTLALDQAPLQLDLSGDLRLPAGAEPAFTGRLEWSGLQWPLVAVEPGLASPEGRVELAGTADAYTIALAAALAGTQVPPGEWRGQGSGDRRSLRLQQLHGSLLGGELELGGELAWDPVPSWTLRVEGRDLDPGQWRPELPGRLVLALNSEGRIDPERGPQVEVELQRLAGRLAGRSLELAAAASVSGDNATLNSLQLQSGGNRVSAGGRLSPRLALDWQLQAPSPGALLPGAEGALSGSGRVEGTPAQPRLHARLQGEGLRLDSRSLSHLKAELQAGPGAEDPLQLDLELGSLQQGDQLLLQAGRMTARGSTADHWLELDLQGPADALQARLEGGLDMAQTAWKGRLADLSLASAGFGSWRLVQPAPLALAASRASLEEACLQSTADAARLCAGGDWSPTAGSVVAAHIRALSMERLLPNLSGELSGQAVGGLAPDGAIRAHAALAMSPGQLRVELAEGSQSLAHDGGSIDLSIDPGGLEALLRLDARDKRLVEADLQLPRFNRLPLPDSQPLAGRIRAEVPDLSGLHALVPQLAATAGRLDADLRLGGTLQQPQVLGELALVDGAADIPAAGLQLRQIELRASGKPENPGQLALAGGLVSGPGRVDAGGWAALSGDAFELSIKGDRVQVFDTPDARVVASPDLRVGWSDQVLSLRGRLLVPEANITPRLGLSPGLIAGDPAAEEVPGRIVAPSPDVVVLGAEEGREAEAAIQGAPFRLDNQVQVILGDRVNVNAVGLVGHIAGAVTFTNQPGDKDLIPTADGSLSIEGGTFRAFGQDLDIETGRVIFAGVPVTQPEISVRAVRWIDNDTQVTAAGIMVTGSLSQPSMELFSRPALDATEVQSYLLTGRPSGGRDSVLSIGTYLNPKLYVGYGYNLLEETNEFNALYTITPRYGVEANVGEADNNLNLTFTYER